MLKEVQIAFQHENCWMLDTTRRHPEVTLVVSGIYESAGDVHADVVVHAQKDLAAAVFAEWKQDTRIHALTKLDEGARGVRYHVAYARERSVYPHVVRHAPITVGSISVAADQERIHVIGTAADVDQIVKQLNRLGTAKVESIRSRTSVPPEARPLYGLAIPTDDAEESALTDRQLEALQLAYAAGYYEWPRRSSATDLARIFGITTTAFLQQLRRAEIHVMNQFIQAVNHQHPDRWTAAKAFLERGRGRHD